MVKTSLDLFSLVLKQVWTYSVFGDRIYQIGKEDYDCKVNVAFTLTSYYHDILKQNGSITKYAWAMKTIME